MTADVPSSVSGALEAGHWLDQRLAGRVRRRAVARLLPHDETRRHGGDVLRVQ